MEIIEENGYGICRFKVRDSDSNYNYIVWCVQTMQSAVIDPLDIQEIMNFIRERDLTIKYIINTHAHPDHIQGNDELQRLTSSKILIHPMGRKYLSRESEGVDEGDLIDIGNVRIKVIHTPGHCPEHTSLILGNNVFVGDTLFLSGCGNTRFRGNVEDLYRSLTFALKPLPENFKVFCGHDYSVKNLKFSLDIEPDNEPAKKKLGEIQKMYSQGIELSSSTIGEEKQ